jgi:LuxR family quorum sensing-dependent transcriptional regulator
MLSAIMAHIEGAYAAPTAEAASIAFFAAMKDFGASYLQTRLYRRPA